MFARIGRIATRRLGLGRFGVPVWIVALAAMLVGAVAGQAVGPVLDGSVQGTAGLTVEQSVLLTSISDSPDSDDYAATVNDDGTGFTIAMETQVGQNQDDVTFTLDNDSGQDANAVLTLRVPAGIDVELTSSGGMDEAQMSPNSWLLSNLSDGDSITLEIEAHDNAAPGFYVITGSLIQVAN